ncbi:MAG: ABC transporter ATP-binding protein [Clostridia bacterium]
MSEKGYHEEETLGKVYDSKLMKRLLSYAAPYFAILIVSIILLFAVAGADLMRPYLVKIVIDGYINNTALAQEEKIQGIISLAVVFLVISTAGFILNYVQVFILTRTGQKIVFNIRQQIFSHIEKLPLSYFDKNPVGRLVTRVTNDTETLNEMYTSVMVNLFKDLLLVAGSIVGMFILDFRLGVITMTVFPLIIGVTLIFRIKARDAYRQVRVRLARLNAVLSENISGMKIIHIFQRQHEKLEQFKKINHDYYRAGMKEVTVYGVFRPAIEMIASLGVTLILWFGGMDIIEGTMEFGVLYAFINYLYQMFQPINDLSEKYNILQSAMASSERIFQILDEKAEVNQPDRILKAETLKGKIEFKNVWFAYNDDEWVLRDVCFTIEAGQTVAFVGATGAGKTSIINLINRFYEIQKGQITIDNMDISKMEKTVLRRNIAVVLQDVFLFSGDIQSNIRLNNSAITEEQVKRIAEYVNASQFIEKLPGKYLHEVKERGVTLSAGQRQLLAFARALVFDPPILVLDEATANIDTETELLIQDALKKLTKDRTTIVIAHRLSTIQHADKIIVLHHGRIREIGNHQELLNQKGMYYDLYRLQMS